MVLLASMIVYAEAHLGPVALGDAHRAVLPLRLPAPRARALPAPRRGAREADASSSPSLQVGVLAAMLRTLSHARPHDRAALRRRRAGTPGSWRRPPGVRRRSRTSSIPPGCFTTSASSSFPTTSCSPTRSSVRGGLAAHQDAPVPGREGGAGGRGVRAGRGHHLGPSRADRRAWVSAGARGGGHPSLQPHDLDRGHLRRHDLARLLPRPGVRSAEAIAELRRVSGKQLDGELVETFVAMLQSKAVAFRHADDADFEAELAFESRVRDHAAPRRAASDRRLTARPRTRTQTPCATSGSPSST